MVSEEVLIIQISFNELPDSQCLPYSLPNHTGMLACPPANSAFHFQILHILLLEWRMPLLPVPANKQRL